MGLVIRLNSSFNNSSLPKLLADYWMRNNPVDDLCFLVDFARSGDHIYNNLNWVFNREIANFRWRIFGGLVYNPYSKITSDAAPLAFHYGLSMNPSAPINESTYSFPFLPSATQAYPIAGTGYGKIAGAKGLFLAYITLPLLSEITSITADTDYYLSGGVSVSTGVDFTSDVASAVLLSDPRDGDKGPQIGIRRSAGGDITIKVGDGVNTTSVVLSAEMKSDLSSAYGRVLQIAYYSVASSSCKLKVTNFVDSTRTVSSTSGGFDISQILPSTNKHLTIPYFGWPGHSNHNALPSNMAASKIGINRVVVTNESTSSTLVDVENRLTADYNYIKQTRNAFQNA